MMLGVSGVMVSSAEGGSAAEHPHESGGASGGSSEVGGPSSVALEETEKGGDGGSGGGGGGKRWPRQETLALIQIRHDMDSAFRDSSLKGPLWEEVSRKMAELGFHRNAKKCKEKFENVFKYHKRTKDGRSSKPDGKTYRFFDQLEALENTPPPPPPQPPRSLAAPPPNSGPTLMPPPQVTITTTAAATTYTLPSNSLSPTPISIIPPQASNPRLNPNNFHRTSNSISSSTSSDEDIHRRRRGKKRKWKDYFERLMRDVVVQQEDTHKRLMDALERRERDRAAREEAWRAQETARMNREHELLLRERQMAAAKDSAVMAFLQKVADQHNLQLPINLTAAPTTAPPPPPPQRAITMQLQPPPLQPQFQKQSTALMPPPPTLTAKTLKKTDGGGESHGNTTPSGSSSSRWPKAEVQALIDLRTSLDLKYQDNGPKGPLWEDISSAMAKLGYSRNAKRCKEKWENINKYYKKVKESSKKRPEDSKTCPYFHQLEAIYKARKEVAGQAGYGPRPDESDLSVMARPEQQWLALPQEHHQQRQVEVIGTANAPPLMVGVHRESAENNEGMEDDEEDDVVDDEDDDDGGGGGGDDDDQGGGYEMVAKI